MKEDPKFYRVCMSVETSTHYIVEADDLESAKEFVVDNENTLKPVYTHEQQSINAYRTKGDYRD